MRRRILKIKNLKNNFYFLFFAIFCWFVVAILAHCLKNVIENVCKLFVCIVLLCVFL